MIKSRPYSKRKSLFGLITSLVLFSCAQKYYTNSSGTTRPVNKNVFSYSKRFKSFPSQLDTNAIYIRHWQYESSNGPKDVYEYFRFFGGGQIIYSGFDSTLNFSNLDDLSRGLIGRYYVTKNQLRIQLFYPVSISRSISKTYGYIKEGNIYTFKDSPETWYGSYGVTKAFNNKIQEWKKQKMTFKFNQAPDW